MNKKIKNIKNALASFMKEEGVSKKQILSDIDSGDYRSQYALRASNYVKMFTGSGSFSMVDIKKALMSESISSKILEAFNSLEVEKAINRFKKTKE
jgi:hypothetical protein